MRLLKGSERVTITSKAPGKLFIAGEYAVVEPGHGAIVVAVSRSVLGRVASSKEVWERTKSKFLPLIGLNIITSIISGLMMIIGIVVFFCAVS